MKSSLLKIKYALPGVIVFISMCFFLPRAQGIFFPQDEFGYWNNAAKICGIDWSSVACGQDSYAYGYSLMLIPLMILCRDPVLMYKATILINGVLASVQCVLILKLVEDLFSDEEKAEMSPGISSRYLTGLICCVYPASLLYLHYTTAEVLLNLLFVIMCHVVLRLSRDGISLKTGAIGATCSLLLFVSHYRTAGVVAAFVLICIFSSDFIKSKRKRIIMTALMAVILMLSAVWIIPKETLFSVDGLIQFILGIGGRVYYIEAASFGVALVGLIVCLRRRNELFYGFMLYSFLFTAMISSFFFIDGHRLDQLIYGRYTEMIMPILIALGLRDIISGEGEKSLRAVILSGIFAVLLTLYADRSGYTEYLPNFVSGIDWAFGYKMPTTATVFIKPYLISLAGFIIIMYSIGRRRATSIVAAIMCVVFIGTTFFLTEKEIYTYQDMDRSDRELEQTIEKLQKDGREWYFLNSPYMNYINLMQFWMMEKPVNLITEDIYDGMDHPVVLTYTTYDRPDMLNDYDNMKESAHFILYYNNNQ